MSCFIELFIHFSVWPHMNQMTREVNSSILFPVHMTRHRILVQETELISWPCIESFCLLSGDRCICYVHNIELSSSAPESMDLFLSVIIQYQIISMWSQNSASHYVDTCLLLRECANISLSLSFSVCSEEHMRSLRVCMCERSVCSWALAVWRRTGVSGRIGWGWCHLQ